MRTRNEDDKEQEEQEGGRPDGGRIHNKENEKEKAQQGT